jgi:type II secretory pathway predicted ATPase ExeA
MYKEFFGLRANPFNVNPDPRYLFLTRHTEEALACLTYGIQSRKGFVLLTGEVGTGKPRSSTSCWSGFGRSGCPPLSS